MRKLFQNWLWWLRLNRMGDWKLAPAPGQMTLGNQRERSDSPLIAGGSTASPGNLSKHLIFLTGKSEPHNTFFFFLMQFKACISFPAHHACGNRPHDFPWYVLFLCPIFLFPFCHVFSSADWPTRILWFFLVSLISRLLLSPGHSQSDHTFLYKCRPKHAFSTDKEKAIPVSRTDTAGASEYWIRHSSTDREKIQKRTIHEN